MDFGDGVSWNRGSMIGKGSYGRVYRATLRDPTSRNCFFPPEMAVKSAEVSSSASIQKEREVYSSIGACPYIISCYGDEITTGRSGTMAYNMMLEFGSGGTLARRIEESGGKGLPELEARMHARSILRGLSHIHQLGYVHCDLKPDNILLVPNSGRIEGLKAKIGDFGLAKKVKSLSQSRKRKLGYYWEGTLMYLSPEAVTDYVQESPSDVWAVGCIVLQMLTGKSPLEGKEGALEFLKKIVAGKEKVEIPNELSKEAKSFLKGCFMKNPKSRFSCEKLLKHRFLDGLDEDEVSDIDESDDEIGFSSVCDTEDDRFSSWSEGCSSSRSDDEEKGAKKARMVDNRSCLYLEGHSFPYSRVSPFGFTLRGFNEVPAP